MKALCDVHIAFKVVYFLQKNGIETKHVNELPNGCFTADPEICDFADQGDYVMITKDADFLDSFLLQKSPRKLLKINLGNITTSRLIAILEENIDYLKSFFETNEGCIEIYSDRIFAYKPN
ncbi:DUF5615 family PIN-like protein [Salmonirosea aquatica]|uniref:DUF5615 domain-containing protein n=1 Tax=Salmonirosea aquatica TaxID=2654236 RepID=A0A7C9BCW0_9BACT|nr:hypothetical protein [Cytophagaceae bacterium SJW1-29]